MWLELNELTFREVMISLLSVSSSAWTAWGWLSTKNMKWLPWNGWCWKFSTSSALCLQSTPLYAGANEDLIDTATKIASKELHDRVHLLYLPSTVAATAVVYASLATDQNEAGRRVVKTHAREKKDAVDMRKCANECPDWYDNALARRQSSGESSGESSEEIE